MTDALIVFATAMAPIGELRGAIPLGLVKYELAWPFVFLLAVAGNLVPVPVLMVALRRVGKRVEQMDNVLGALLRWRTRRIVERWGALSRRYDFFALVLLVAIPLPFTGAWTGTLAAWALDIPPRRALPAIVVGVVIAGVIVTGLAVAGVEAFRHV